MAWHFICLNPKGRDQLQPRRQPYQGFPFPLQFPLHLAAEYGHKEIASLLLDIGAQADFGNWSDKTALHYAAEKGHIEIIELLLSKGANLNALGGGEKRTPLDLATRFKRNKAAAFLRAKKAKTGEELEAEGK